MVLDDPSTHDGADYWLHPCATELQGEVMTAREHFFAMVAVLQLV